MPRRSVVEYINELGERQSDVAFVNRRGYRAIRWTYAQIVERASQVARELERRGVGKGDRVVIWGEDCAEWVASFYGCILRGAVAVPLDKGAASEFARRIA